MYRPKSRIYIALLVTSLIVISSWFFLSSNQSKDTHRDLKDAISLEQERSQELEEKFKESENIRILKLEEENNLRSDLDDIIEQYDNSRDEIDNLNIDLDEKQFEIDSLKSEIRNLLNVENDFKKAKKKIVALQNISKKYFEQVDSLSAETELLVLENKNLKEENILIKNKNKNLNEELNEKDKRIDLGSTLEVKQITFSKIKYGKKGKEIKTIFRRNIQVLRCKLLIAANKVAKAEKKLVYIQYISPNGTILQSSNTPDGSEFEYKDSTIQVTTYSSFDYKNNEMEIEVDWQRGNMLEKGKYKILVFIEEKLVGESSFKLN